MSRLGGARGRIAVGAVVLQGRSDTVGAAAVAVSNVATGLPYSYHFTMRNATLVPAFNSRQAAFVDHVLTGCSATVAAQRAGYSERSARQIATRLLSKASIRGEVEARQGVDSQRLQLERQDVVAGLLEAIGIARERQEPAAMIRGWAELARLMGFYAPERRQVEVTAGADMRRLEAMSDAELLAIVAGQG